MAEVKNARENIIFKAVKNSNDLITVALKKQEEEKGLPFGDEILSSASPQSESPLSGPYSPISPSLSNPKTEEEIELTPYDREGEKEKESLAKAAYDAGLTNSYNDIDILITWDRIGFQLTTKLTTPDYDPKQHRDVLTHHLSQNQDLAIGTVVAGGTLLGSLGLALDEYRDIVKERNTDLVKMFNFFQKKFNALQTEQEREEWIKRHNAILNEIANKDPIFSELELIRNGNQLSGFRANLREDLTERLKEELRKKEAEENKKPITFWEKTKSAIASVWKPVKSHTEELWDASYVAPLAYWPLWAGGALITGMIGVGIAAASAISIAFGFALPVTFLAIYLTLVVVDYLKDKMIHSSIWKFYFDTFFSRTKYSKSDDIPTRLFSAFLNFFRYLAGTLLLSTIIFPAAFLIENAVRKPSGYAPIAEETPALEKARKEKITDGLRNVFRKMAISNEYYEKGITPQPQAEIKKEQESEQKDSQTDEPKVWKSKPNIYMRTLLHFIITPTNLIIGGLFMGWFMLDTFALFSLTISATVLWPVGIAILATALFASILNTINFYVETKKKYQAIDDSYHDFDHLRKKKKELIALKGEFNVLLASVSEEQRKKLKQEASDIPDFINSNIFKDIDDEKTWVEKLLAFFGIHYTRNEDPWYVNLAAYTAIAVSLGTGALILRMMVLGAVDLVPATITNVGVAALLGVSTVTGGILIMVLIALFAITYALIKNAYNQDAKSHANIELLIQQKDAREFTIDKQILFYKGKIAGKKDSLEIGHEDTQAAIKPTLADRDVPANVASLLDKHGDKSLHHHSQQKSNSQFEVDQSRRHLIDDNLPSEGITVV